MSNEEDTLENRNNIQKEPEKIGLIERFLDWIAQGTEKQPIGKTACPT